jgi:hypothetical protein
MRNEFLLKRRKNEEDWEEETKMHQKFCPSPSHVWR